MYDLLKGVRVLDLTSVVLGPFATQYLGDFGADVIKVEPLSGDIFRYARPARSEDMGAGFLNINRNKRSLCLNLKDEQHYDRFCSLLDEADVLVHNMRPSAAKRLGLSPEDIKSNYPHLVYCMAPGFGRRGRHAEKPAYDDIIQSASGIAALNRGTEGEPRFVPTILCDKVGGLHLALAVLAGLVHKEKTQLGCVIEAPMFEGMVSFLMAEQLAGQTFQPALGGFGYDRLLSPNRRPHKTSDGYIGVLPYNARHWQLVLEFIGSDLAQQDWLQSSSERSARVDELYSVLSEAMTERTTEQWLKIFNDLDIPCTPVNRMDDLLNDAHLNDVEFFGQTQHPSEGHLRTVHSPFWVDGVEQTDDTPAPNRGTDSESVSWCPRR